MNIGMLQLAKAIEARTAGPGGQTALPDVPLRGRLVIDSRQVKPGDVFVALPGTKTDGHRYVPQAFAAGAAACIVREAPQNPAGICLVVEDPRASMHRAAAAMRETLTHVRMVAVTGSCGKTSTKEFIAAALRMFGKTTATEGNANNDLGVPMTLSTFDGHESFGVLEAGMNAFGEIDFLSSLIRPEVGVVTSIFPAHLEGVGSLDGVRRAKGEMARHVQKAWVVPQTEPYLAELGRNCGVRVLTFGNGSNADFHLEECEFRMESTRAACITPAGRIEFDVPAPGEHQALNAAAALAAVFALGLDLETAARGLKMAQLPGARSRLFSIGGVTFLDDSYNASPGSLKAVLSWVAQMRTGDVHLLTGDMLELGEHAKSLHRQAGVDAAKLEPRSVFYVGEHADAFAAGLGMPDRFFPCQTPEEAADQLIGRLAHGDWVVIKASHGVGLQRAVERIHELTSCSCT